ncbi:MAG: hypothetical protein K6G60_04895 [Lachnospiraceae bacterium]|nr:hypothetical protein [Lachnospiraceae bacterium]
MPRSRSPDVIEAEKMYREGKLLKEIAAKLKVAEGTVRSWKSRGKWDQPLKKNERNVAKKTKKESATLQKRKRGGQPGNKNAKGGPPGNHKALKHGGYAKLRWDFLDDEEKELLQEFPDENESEMALVESLKLYTLRERKLMKAIKKYEDEVTPVVVQMSSRTESKRTFDGTPEQQEVQREEYERRIQEKIDAGERLPGREYSSFTQTENKDHVISRLQQELTTVQRAKDKAADMLEHLRNERRKMESESAGSDVVNDWISAVMGGGGTDE